MKLFQSADVLGLTGLTRSQLREWCGSSRRGIIRPDVDPAGPGRHALFAWQTILTLRVLKSLRSDFGIELSAWAAATRGLRAELDRKSFPSLWDSVAYFPDHETAILITDIGIIGKFAGIVIPLNPHLTTLATKLPVAPPEQFSLFPPMVISR